MASGHRGRHKALTHTGPCQKWLKRFLTGKWMCRCQHACSKPPSASSFHPFHPGHLLAPALFAGAPTRACYCERLCARAHTRTCTHSHHACTPCTTSMLPGQLPPPPSSLPRCSTDTARALLCVDACAHTTHTYKNTYPCTCM